MLKAHICVICRTLLSEPTFLLCNVFFSHEITDGEFIYTGANVTNRLGPPKQTFTTCMREIPLRLSNEPHRTFYVHMRRYGIIL